MSWIQSDSHTGGITLDTGHQHMASQTVTQEASHWIPGISTWPVRQSHRRHHIGYRASAHGQSDSHTGGITLDTGHQHMASQTGGITLDTGHQHMASQTVTQEASHWIPGISTWPVRQSHRRHHIGYWSQSPNTATSTASSDTITDRQTNDLYLFISPTIGGGQILLALCQSC